MTPDRPLDSAQASLGSVRSRREHLFAGLTWKGVALVALLCLFNALRQTARLFFGEDDPLVDLLVMLVESFGLSLIVLLLTTLTVVATYNHAPPAPRSRYPALVLAVLVSSAVGTAIVGAVVSRATLENFVEQERGSLGWWIVAVWPRYAVLGLLIAAVFAFFRIREESEAARHRAELDRGASPSRWTKRACRCCRRRSSRISSSTRSPTSAASIKPTLQQRVDAREPDGLSRRRAAADAGRRSTLGREAALTESYLAIQRIRMGRRLTFDFEIPESLREAPMPPMMLLTLTENAIKHGLNPLPEGGFVRVSARVAGGQLRLQVADSGQGFTKTSGGGMGLANTRARLAAMYGGSPA